MRDDGDARLARGGFGGRQGEYSAFESDERSKQASAFSVDAYRRMNYMREQSEITDTERIERYY